MHQFQDFPKDFLLNRSCDTLINSSDLFIITYGIKNLQLNSYYRVCTSLETLFVYTAISPASWAKIVDGWVIHIVG